jgi:hypothetical protein
MWRRASNIPSWTLNFGSLAKRVVFRKRKIRIGKLEEKIFRQNLFFKLKQY